MSTLGKLAVLLFCLAFWFVVAKALFRWCCT